MNQGKIWLVVKPTVGLPLFLGGVTVIALAVHTAVLTNTKWYPAYYSGKAAVAAVLPAKTAQATPAATPVVATAAVAMAKAEPAKP